MSLDFILSTPKNVSHLFLRILYYPLTIFQLDNTTRIKIAGAFVTFA